VSIWAAADDEEYFPDFVAWRHIAADRDRIVVNDGTGVEGME
jgi:hypothetical protein